jgi:hypothetical protein
MPRNGSLAASSALPHARCRVTRLEAHVSEILTSTICLRPIFGVIGASSCGRCRRRAAGPNRHL